MATSVTLFLRNIPSDASNLELTRFVEGGFGAWHRLLGWVTRKPLVIEARTLAIWDQNTNQIELHGVVSVQPYSAYSSVLAKLNAARFKNSPVEARRYYQRSPLNDRRLNRGKPVDPEILNRRVGDRRRSNVVICEFNAALS
jgi:hypothetical protein